MFLDFKLTAKRNYNDTEMFFITGATIVNKCEM